MNGDFEPKTTVKAITWPAPDHNGDGEQLFDEEQNEKLDEHDRPLFRYAPPDGFVNIQNSEGVDCWVMGPNRRQIKRTPQGEAIETREGRTILLYPDGNAKYLENDKDRRVFLATHTEVTVEAPETEDATPAPKKATAKTKEKEAA